MEAPITFDSVREELSRLLISIGYLGEGIGSPAIQEIVLARRHIEDARMRLGVALTYQKGQDPWQDSNKEK